MTFDEVMDKIEPVWTRLEEQLHETFHEPNSTFEVTLAAALQAQAAAEPERFEVPPVVPKPQIPLGYHMSGSIVGAYPQAERKQLARSTASLYLQAPSFHISPQELWGAEWSELESLFTQLAKLACLAAGHNPYLQLGIVAFPTAFVGERQIGFGMTLNEASWWFGSRALRSKVAEMWPDRDELLAQAFAVYQAEMAAHRQPDVETAAKVPTYLEEHQPEYLH